MLAYLRIARVDHWVKNIFILPGVLMAWVLTYPDPDVKLAALAWGSLAVCLITSANYTINEFLDRKFDQFHPVKKQRPGAQGQLKGALVAVQYLALAAAGLAIAWAINQGFFISAAFLLVMGIVYNVEPLRTKDVVYLDVLSESINNPLRFLLGWFMVSAASFPPSSILISYWTGGAFLMSVKRYSEYRMINDPALAGEYRKSFKNYTEAKLLVTSVFYAINSAFFLAIFLIKYRIELLLSFPLFAILFSWYLAIGLKAESAAQAPERLYREKRFMAFVVLLAAVVVLLIFVDIPILNRLQEPLVFGLGNPLPFGGEWPKSSP